LHLAQISKTTPEETRTVNITSYVELQVAQFIPLQVAQFWPPMFGAPGQFKLLARTMRVARKRYLNIFYRYDLNTRLITTFTTNNH